MTIPLDKPEPPMAGLGQWIWRHRADALVVMELLGFSFPRWRPRRRSVWRRWRWSRSKSGRGWNALVAIIGRRANYSAMANGACDRASLDFSCRSSYLYDSR